MRPRRWWTPEDLTRFDALAEPLVQQFSAYRPYPDLAVDGKSSRSENIADLGGLAAAFDAYRLTLGGRVTDTAFVRRQDREFFTGFAQSYALTAPIPTNGKLHVAPEPRDESGVYRTRLAVFTPVVRASFDVVDEFAPSVRGAGGFGSSGRH